MSSTVHYGTSASDRLAEENLTCRKIVKEIGDFGVTDRQRLMIIYLLALELENVQHMREVTATVRGLEGADVFLVDKDEA